MQKRPLEEWEKQKIIDSQLSKPVRNKVGGSTNIKEEIKDNDDGSSSYYSSDEADWADPDYIEEQRAALAEFAAK